MRGPGLGRAALPPLLASKRELDHWREDGIARVNEYRARLKSNEESLAAQAGLLEASGHVAARLACLGDAWYEAAPALDCERFETELARDREALQRHQRAIALGQAELAEWTRKNDAAQKAALKRATYFLVDSMVQAGRDHRGPAGEAGGRAPPARAGGRDLARQAGAAAAPGGRRPAFGALDGIKLAELVGSASLPRRRY